MKEQNFSQHHIPLGIYSLVKDLSRSQIVGIALAVIAVFLLVPGVLQPIISIKIETNVDASLAQFTSKNLDKTRSIVGTVQDLYQSGDTFVAFLILFFSVLVPACKSGLVGIALFSETLKRKKIIAFIDLIGKWSMADVFVVAIFICFLSTVGQGHTENHNIVAFGMRIPVRMATVMSSRLEPGFYFFLSYCLCSLASLHFLRKTKAQT